MMKEFILLATFLSIILLINSADGRKIRHTSLNQYDSNKPLILTDLIQKGSVNEARSQAKVNLPGFPDLECYSGFFTVNESCNSNMFFWYFPAEKDPKNAPVILWLEGGPGSSSLLSTVIENGPIHLVESGETSRANYSWSLNHHLIYIDNPVGVGYSFADSIDCIPTEEISVGNQIYDALVQFFQLFPNLQENGFYISGESYAGHYVPATAFTVHMKNSQEKHHINLQGIAVGNGLIDTLYQHRYSPYLYQIGLVDEDGRKLLEIEEEKITNAIKSGDLALAADLQFAMLWSENGKSLFTNLTGLKEYYNYVTGFDLLGGIGPAIIGYFNRDDIKKALHCGDLPYLIGSADVSKQLRLDMFVSTAPMVKVLLNSGYRVLLYNGQLDVIVGYPLTRDFINQFDFDGKADFKAAQRHIWQVDQDVAGYVRDGGNLALALVRNAGHAVAVDEPKHLLDLLLGFTHPSCVEFRENRRVLSDECKAKFLQ